MTKIVNIYGAPGAGKSTAAAMIFSKLKMAGVNAELVTEFAKDCVYEKRMTVMANQVYLFAKQHHRIERIMDQVDVIITDSPLDLGKYYGARLHYSKELNAMIDKITSKYDTFDLYLTRNFDYQEEGRIQSKEEIDKVENEIGAMYKDKCLCVESTPANIDRVCEMLLKILKINS